MRIFRSNPTLPYPQAEKATQYNSNLFWYLNNNCLSHALAEVIVIYIYPVWIDDKNSSKEEEIEVGWKQNKSNCRPRLQWEASMINLCLLNLTWIRRPQRVLRWLESFGRRKRRLLDMMARGPRTPEKWKIKKVFCFVRSTHPMWRGRAPSCYPWG